MSETMSGSDGSCVNGLGFCHTPAELEIQPEVPAGDNDDGHAVRQVPVHPEQIELQIQQHGIEYQTTQTNELELREPLHAMPKASLVRCNVIKGPGVVPDEVVNDGQLRRDHLASRKTPGEHRWIAEQE